MYDQIQIWIMHDMSNFYIFRIYLRLRNMPYDCICCKCAQLVYVCSNMSIVCSNIDFYNPLCLFMSVHNGTLLSTKFEKPLGQIFY